MGRRFFVHPHHDADEETERAFQILQGNGCFDRIMTVALDY